MATAAGQNEKHSWIAKTILGIINKTMRSGHSKFDKKFYLDIQNGIEEIGHLK